MIHAYCLRCRHPSGRCTSSPVGKAQTTVRGQRAQPRVLDAEPERLLDPIFPDGTRPTGAATLVERSDER